MADRTRANRQIWITRSHLVALGLATCCIALLAFLVGLQVGRAQAAAAEVVAEAPLPLTPDVSKEEALEALLREVELAQASMGGASAPPPEDLTFPALLEPVEPALALPKAAGSSVGATTATPAPGQAPAPPAQATAPEAPAAATGWAVQIASHPTTAEADALIAQLKEGGHAAYRVAALVDGQTWHRVRIGGFSSKARAEVARRSLADELEAPDLLLTEAP